MDDKAQRDINRYQMNKLLHSTGLGHMADPPTAPTPPVTASGRAASALGLVIGAAVVVLMILLFLSNL